MMTLDEFVFDVPLYVKVVDAEENSIISALSGWNVNKIVVNGYNPIDQCDTTYTLHYGLGSYHSFLGGDLPKISYTGNKVDLYDVHEVIFKCRRFGTKLHILVKVVEEDSGTYIMKVGQSPSVADIHIGQVHKYNKVLSKERMREFTKAIGLAANGVGIGSFVYLRRIFEHLVFEALETAKKVDTEFNETAFTSARMNERIQMLSDYLPDFLVENHNIYGILSKGVHELSEEECKKYFTVLKESIEIILDEKLEAFRKAKHKKAIGDAIAEITGAIK